MQNVMPGNCLDAENRKIVLVVFRGGNDGLNTLVPLNTNNNNQDLYANTLRPTTGLNLTGANAVIPLDNTLEVGDQV